MFDSILFPVDTGHPNQSEKAAKEVVALVRLTGAKLTLLSVVPDFGMAIVGSFFPADFLEKAKAEGKKALAEFRASHIPEEMACDQVLVQGNIYERIIAEADKRACDLIVMASHRPELADYLLGPNAARVVRHARQSVLVVR